MACSSYENSAYHVSTYSVTENLSYSIAHEINNTIKKGNGGLRFYRYSNKQDQEAEALMLAKDMTAKHNIYSTGFSGAKIVANGENTPENKIALLDHLAGTLNEFKGKLYTGCDLNITNKDMNYLHRFTPYILNAVDAPQINTSTATAMGVLGSLLAVTGSQPSEPQTYMIHGLGKIGSIIAKELLANNHKVYCYDLNAQYADIPGAINISDKQDWYKTQCDYFVPCSASHIITTDIAHNLNCRWIVGSANSPFDNQQVIDILRDRKIDWIPDVISNAGAILCDEIEFRSPDSYKKVLPEVLYQLISQRIYKKTQYLLDVKKNYQLHESDTLKIFLKMAEPDLVAI